MKQKLQTAKERILQEYGREPKTLDELAECVTAVINSQCQNNLVGFEWELKYTKTVSNSHSAPVGYPQNFGPKPGIPTYYPGWSGRVWVRYRDKTIANKMWSYTPFAATLTHTGTGGSGSYNGSWAPICRAHYEMERNNFLKHMPVKIEKPACYSWDYKIFEYDWPVVAYNKEQEQLVAILSDKIDSFPTTHKFHWVDPEVDKADKKFLKEAKTLLQKHPETIVFNV